jgi:superfamily II DNA/RNA helicase
MSQHTTYRGGDQRRSRNYSGNSDRPNSSRNRSYRPRRGGGFGGGRSSGRRKMKKEKDLDVSLYTQIANREPKEIEESALKFNDFGLNKQLQQVIADRGFDRPTKIQEELIPKMMLGQDVVAVSETGSGKTGAYLIPILNQYLSKRQAPDQFQTLIVVPTRELAYQIDKELNDFNLRGFKLWSVICIGGTDMRRQIQQAKKPNQFIIGTPGRLIDLIDKGVIKLSQVQTVILDEMDRMLDMGFIDDISTILQGIPLNTQKGFFSATLNKKIEPTLNRFAKDVPVTKISHPKPSEFVDQSMIELSREDRKIDTLVNILDEKRPKSIIFANTKSETEFIYNKLNSLGFTADYIHGDRQQSTRTRIIKQFRQIPEAVLVATDVAARGLDIDDVTLVINYDEPHSEEDYIHRIGRTGRAGRFGQAITLVKR